jgi:hypothetical protein
MSGFTQHDISSCLPLAEFENLEVRARWLLGRTHLRELIVRHSEDREFPSMYLVQLVKARKEAVVCPAITVDPEPELGFSRTAFECWALRFEVGRVSF